MKLNRVNPCRVTIYVKSCDLPFMFTWLLKSKFTVISESVRDKSEESQFSTLFVCKLTMTHDPQVTCPGKCYFAVISETVTEPKRSIFSTLSANFDGTWPSRSHDLEKDHLRKGSSGKFVISENDRMCESVSLVFERAKMPLGSNLLF